MQTNYELRRGEIRNYFDRTAVDAWARLTSTEQVSRIRETVRAGREEMRNTLLGWLPQNLAGVRVLDAGCGTGLLAFELARRGAEVTAVDLSPTLVQLAQERLPADLAHNPPRFIAGDMTDTSHGDFDYVISMDSVIHYNVPDAVAIVSRLAQCARQGVMFTFAPKSPALAAMHGVGKLFPRGDRSPRIVPVYESRLRRALASADELQSFGAGRTQRVSRGFYTSQAFELYR